MVEYSLKGYLTCWCAWIKWPRWIKCILDSNGLQVLSSVVRHWCKKHGEWFSWVMKASIFFISGPQEWSVLNKGRRWIWIKLGRAPWGDVARIERPWEGFMTDLMIHKFFAILIDLGMENLGELLEQLLLEDLTMSRVWGRLYLIWVCLWSCVGGAKH